MVKYTHNFNQKIMSKEAACMKCAKVELRRILQLILKDWDVMGSFGS
jgi:hypothetical protein